MGGWVYIMASARNGTLYTGVTSDLYQRGLEHRYGATPGFASRYGCERLVWHERHHDIETAIQRENSIKRYRQAWKLRLIETLNPTWDDLLDRFSDEDNLFQPSFTRRFDADGEALGQGLDSRDGARESRNEAMVERALTAKAPMFGNPAPYPSSCSGPVPSIQMRRC